MVGCTPVRQTSPKNPKPRVANVHTERYESHACMSITLNNVGCLAGFIHSNNRTVSLSLPPPSRHRTSSIPRRPYIVPFALTKTCFFPKCRPLTPSLPSDSCHTAGCRPPRNPWVPPSCCARSWLFPFLPNHRNNRDRATII
jgi:hypothetical protein